MFNDGKQKKYIYYIYSFTIARNDGIKTEIKNHQKNSWVEVVDPQLWRRIQEEGTKVSKEEAEELYHYFHQQIISDI